MHDPLESYKMGQFQALTSVEIWQPKSEDLCIEFYGKAISASSDSYYYYYSYCIRVRPSDSRQQAVSTVLCYGSRPRPASTFDYQLLSTATYADIIDGRCLHHADTSCQPVHHYTDCMG